MKTITLELTELELRFLTSSVNLNRLEKELDWTKALINNASDEECELQKSMASTLKGLLDKIKNA